MIAGALSHLKPLLGLDDLLLSSLTWLLIGGFGPLLAIGQETSPRPINSIEQAILELVQIQGEGR